MNVSSRWSHAAGRDRLIPPRTSCRSRGGISDPALQVERNRTAGFTLVELLIGLSLSLIIMAGVLSSYIFLGRSFTRSLGITSANQPNLESKGRRALAYFAQDVRMASGISGTPSASSLTLTLPASSGTTAVTYTYDSTAHSLTRTPTSGNAMVLLTNLLTNPTNPPYFYFRYYDASGNPYDNGTSPYTSVTNYLPGIKQLSMTFTAQAGSSTNGTLTQVYRSDSSRLILRNKQFLP
jgi:prepilin-type N-terminal cleavage/methylation domain-containing protein